MRKERKIWSHPISIDNNPIKLDKTFNILFELTLTEDLNCSIINSIIEYDQLLRILNYTYNGLSAKRINSTLHIKHNEQDTMKDFLKLMKDFNIIESKYLIENKSQSDIEEIYFSGQKINIHVDQTLKILNLDIDLDLFSKYNDPLFMKYVFMHNCAHDIEKMSKKWKQISNKSFIKNPILSVDALQFLHYNIDIPATMVHIEKMKKLKKEIDLTGILNIMGLIPLQRKEHPE